ncbi:unnamed protein product [Hymenolepis diminuta]|uniref:dCMP deaminase n=1 Tax=Hymenolepis diminuta TaxID=6216 RepID=A0A3P7B9R8_HYMDI|nr:unnamed protein product [Hymenolepis diminuta]
MKLFKPRQQAKRTDYLQWDEYFMSLAFLSAMRSKDPSTQVGACIVSQDNKIVSMGYNGMPVGLSDDDIPWTKNQEDVLQNKSFYVCHAELNAVINKNVLSLQDCRMYTTLFPCHECAKVIIQSGIKEIVYFDDKKANFCDEFTVKTQTKRENVMTWDEYFMSLAIVTSMRSKDPCMQVGACIVNAKNRVIALGYNGFPDGLSDEDLPWTKFQEDPLQNKNHYVIHAEQNAILNKNQMNLDQCRIYTTLFPCNECARYIIQSGIKEVIYLNAKSFEKTSYAASKIMLTKAKTLSKDWEEIYN